MKFQPYILNISDYSFMFISHTYPSYIKYLKKIMKLHLHGRFSIALTLWHADN